MRIPYDKVCIVWHFRPLSTGPSLYLFSHLAFYLYQLHYPQMASQYWGQPCPNHHHTLHSCNRNSHHRYLPKLRSPDLVLVEVDEAAVVNDTLAWVVQWQVILGEEHVGLGPLALF